MAAAAAIAASVFVLLFLRIAYVFIHIGKQLRRSSPVQPLNTLIILGSGGHTAEMMNLLSALEMDKLHPRTYVAAATDNMSLQKARVFEESLASGATSDCSTPSGHWIRSPTTIVNDVPYLDQHKEKIYLPIDNVKRYVIGKYIAAICQDQLDKKTLEILSRWKSLIRMNTNLVGLNPNLDVMHTDVCDILTFSMLVPYDVHVIGDHDTGSFLRLPFYGNLTSSGSPLLAEYECYVEFLTRRLVVQKSAGNAASFVQIYRSREVGQSYFTSVGTTLIAVAHAFWLTFKIKPQVVLCNGPGTCIPLCVAAFLFKVAGFRWSSIFYVESIARVRKLSLSGLLLYKLHLADQFFVQWPKLQKAYPRAQYVGCLM